MRRASRREAWHSLGLVSPDYSRCRQVEQSDLSAVARRAKAEACPPSVFTILRGWWARRSAPLPTLRRQEQRKSRQKLLLGPRRGPGRQIIAFRCLGQAGIAAEQAFCFGHRKSGQMGRFEIGGATVDGLDRLRDVIGQHWRQAEADMDRRQQALFHHVVVAAEYYLERRDHVAHDIFPSVVYQIRQP